MKIFKQIGKDSAIYGGVDFLTKLVYFFVFPIIASVLSPEEFGALELIYTTIGLLGIIMACGLNGAIQRFYWDDQSTEEIQAKIVTSGFFSQLTFGCAIMAFASFFLPFSIDLAQESKLPITEITLIAAVLLLALRQWSQYIIDVIRLHFAPWRFFAYTLLTRIFSISFSVITVVFLGYGIEGMIVGETLVLILLLPLGIWMIRRDLSIFSFSFPWAKDLVKLGYPLIFAGIAYWLFGSMDRWMLATMSSVEEVGIYSVAFRFASVVLFVSVAFGQAWSPIAIKIRTEHPESYRKIYGQVFLLLFFVMLVAGGGAALFAGEAMSLIMPKEYLASALPLSILCFGIVLQSTQQVTAIGISIEKKTFLLARLAWVTAFVNFCGNYLLIPRFGADGAACTTLISYAVLTSSYLFFTQRLHPLDLEWKRFVGLFLMGCLVAAVSFMFISFQINGVLIALKIALALLCLYCGWRILPLKSIRSARL
ncbi:oligosaccharide flippase family protein [Verrucomicrobia bacterium]|nr:oligosaccharide flippase family protein [Verrucomicrobiota bacterium]